MIKRTLGGLLAVALLSTACAQPPATTVASVFDAVDKIRNSVGEVSAGIAQACTRAKPKIALLKLVLTGTARDYLDSVDQGCTDAGQVAMTLKDGAPVTATNSGDSAGWVDDTIAFLKSVAQSSDIRAPRDPWHFAIEGEALALPIRYPT